MHWAHKAENNDDNFLFTGYTKHLKMHMVLDPYSQPARLVMHHTILWILHNNIRREQTELKVGTSRNMEASWGWARPGITVCIMKREKKNKCIFIKWRWWITLFIYPFHSAMSFFLILFSGYRLVQFCFLCWWVWILLLYCWMERAAINGFVWGGFSLWLLYFLY